jgi:hypothetical protein
MSLPNFLTLPFWNNLASGHLSELIMVLTAAIIVLLDRHIRKLVNQHTKSHGRVVRFLIFLAVCSAGYAALALGTSWALRQGLTLHRGAYMAPIALAILVVVAIGAERQKQM